MFTSRAEYRLSLREDNADIRLTAVGRELGSVDDTRWSRFTRKRDLIEAEVGRLRATWLNPRRVEQERALALLGQPLESEQSLEALLRRPQVTLKILAELAPEAAGPAFDDPQVAEQVEIRIKYQGYVDRQRLEVERSSSQEALAIPADFDFAVVPSLSNEIRQKLDAIRPATVGQASRIPGMTPAAISLLLVSLKRRQPGPRSPEQQPLGRKGNRRGREMAP
jgi:tRNA uridine 5-carboxymethylaminomethyl modification enzyme